MGGEVGGGNSNTMSASDRAQLLVDSFGSRKKQKVMNSRAANRVNVHSVVGSGDAMMRSVTEQRGISDENRRVMMEERGNEKVRRWSILFFIFLMLDDDDTSPLRLFLVLRFSAVVPILE